MQTVRPNKKKLENGPFEKCCKECQLFSPKSISLQPEVNYPIKETEFSTSGWGLNEYKLINMGAKLPDTFASSETDYHLVNFI